jgi:hypothetical protein
MRCLVSQFIPSTRMVLALLAYCIFYANPAATRQSGNYIVPYGIIVQVAANNPVG